MNIFLRQELDRMQKVISQVRNTLYDLKLAIEGTIIMSETLRDALDCMYDAKIPKAWLRVSSIRTHVFVPQDPTLVLHLLNSWAVNHAQSITAQSTTNL